MKRLVIAYLLVAGVVSATVAQSPAFDYRAGFSAIVVRDVDASVDWYKKVFGLNTIKEISDQNIGMKIVILESPSLTLELLQLGGSLSRKDLVQGKKEGTEIQGHLKMGFTVPNIDACIKHLSSLKIEVPRVWTDSDTKRRNFLITDPEGNLIQFFEK
jgi:catechol 2,3-dioxygenase-like lactoylglutathione lyase family enzyme